MSDVIAYIFDTVPWLATFLAWTTAVFVALFVFGILSALFLLPILGQAREHGRKWIEALRDRHRKNRLERLDLWRESADAFRQDNLLKRISDGGRSLIAGVAARVRRQLKKLAKAMANFTAELKNLHKSAAKLTESLKAFTFALTGDGTELPEAPRMLQQTRGLGVAWFQFSIGMFLMMGMATVNTVMLSQILRDIGFIPIVYQVWGIPLVYFLALLLSVAEAGLGFWHATLTARPQGSEDDDEEAPILWPLFVLVLTLFLSAWEGQNYGAIVSDRTIVVNIPFTQFTMPKGDVFFLLGFAIVWTLFGLGSVCYRSGTRVIEGSAPRRLQRQLRKLRRSADECDSILRGAEDILVKARKAAGDGASAAVDSKALDELKRQLDRMEPANREAGVAEERDLTHTEVVQLSQQAGFWMGAGVVGAIIMTLTGLESFSVLAPGLENWLAWVLAVGQAVVFLSAGMLCASQQTVAKGETGMVVESPLWSVLLGMMLGLVLVSIYVWTLFTAARSIQLVWTCNFLFGLLLFAVGYRIQPLMGVATLFARAIANSAATAIEFIIRGIAGLLYAVAVVLYYIAAAVARPLLALWNRLWNRRRMSEESARHMTSGQ